MTWKLKQLSKKMSSFFVALFGSAVLKQEAHKKLIHHLVELGKKKSETDIISETAHSMKNILNYRLFAFVLKKENNINVWLDPGRYRHSLEKTIQSDFNIKDAHDIQYLNHELSPDEPACDFNPDDLVYYDLDEEEIRARIYLLPANPASAFYDEMTGLILQGCCAALSRQIKIRDLKNAAVIDPLTGCYNRREFENQLKRNIAGAVRHKTRLSLFLFDLDHFKQVNDTFGHLAGDKVLKQISSLVMKNMRSGDILARYGGEEFIAILPETDRLKAMELADRLREKISETPIPFNDDIIRVTASFGVAQLQQNAEMSRIIQDADTMLYKAKMNGRNTVMPGLIKVMPSKNFQYS